MKFSVSLFKKNLFNFHLSKYKNFWLRIYSLFFLLVIIESCLDFSLPCVQSRSLCVHKAKSVWDYATHMYFKCLQTEFKCSWIQLGSTVLTLFSVSYKSWVQIRESLIPCLLLCFVQNGAVLKLWDIWLHFSMKWSLRGGLLCNLRHRSVFCQSRCFELLFLKIPPVTINQAIFPNHHLSLQRKEGTSPLE